MAGVPGMTFLDYGVILCLKAFHYQGIADLFFPQGSLPLPCWNSLKPHKPL
jgi:hypothetical protein